MRYALPGRKLMKDCTSGNPDKLPPLFGLLVDRIARGLVTGQVVVPFLYGLGFGKLIVVGGDAVYAVVRWNRDFAFFTCDDEVTEVPPVCTVETVLQSLIKR